MSLLDKFIDKEKAAKATIKDPRELFNNILRQTSGSAFTRELKYNIFYTTIAFRGIVDGVGTSTLVANTALALAKLGLTVCVIDTSVLAPVQDVLLKTNESVDTEDDGQEHLDWFDMPYTRKSVLHISGLNKNISVLSFKGKKHGVIDMLSTNDSATLVDIALTELHNKFDLILIDCCHELTDVNTACIQQAQQVIQVWNDTPVVMASLENFITNSIVLSCPLDKMRNVVYSRIVKDAIGNMDSVLAQYRFKCIARNYFSKELAMLIVTGKTLWQAESTDEDVIAYTESIIAITCHILNIRDDDEEETRGAVTSNDIMEGKVEGTLHKALKDANEEFEKEHPEVTIQRPSSINDLDMVDQNGDGVIDDRELTESIEGRVNVSDDDAYSGTMEEDTPVLVSKKRGLFGGKKKGGKK